LGQVPKPADATTSSAVEGTPDAAAAILTGSLGPTTDMPLFILAPTPGCDKRLPDGFHPNSTQVYLKRHKSDRTRSYCHRQVNYCERLGRNGRKVRPASGLERRDVGCSPALASHLMLALKATFGAIRRAHVSSAVPEALAG
jgi:hypothetical protein